MEEEKMRVYFVKFDDSSSITITASNYADLARTAIKENELKQSTTISEVWVKCEKVGL